MEDNNTSSSAGGASIKHEDPSVTLTIRLIMQGKVSGNLNILRWQIKFYK